EGSRFAGSRQARGPGGAVVRHPGRARTRQHSKDGGAADGGGRQDRVREAGVTAMRNWKILAVLVLLVLIGIGLGLPMLRYIHENAAHQQCVNNLKRIALALHLYHDQHGSFPPGASGDAALPLESQYSWHFFLLPYVESGDVYRVVDRKQAWNSSLNCRFTD